MIMRGKRQSLSPGLEMFFQGIFGFAQCEFNFAFEQVLSFFLLFVVLQGVAMTLLMCKFCPHIQVPRQQISLLKV